MFRPCNYTLEILIEKQEAAKLRGHQRRQEKMQRGSLPPDVAANYERFDAAVLLSLKKLHAIEQTHPELLENPQ